MMGEGTSIQSVEMLVKSFAHFGPSPDGAVERDLVAAIHRKIEEAVLAEREAIAKWHEEQAARLEEIPDASSAVHYSILTHKRSAAAIRVGHAIAILAGYGGHDAVKEKDHE